jgi:hypothetical protein
MPTAKTQARKVFRENDAIATWTKIIEPVADMFLPFGPEKRANVFAHVRFKVKKQHKFSIW